MGDKATAAKLAQLLREHKPLSEMSWEQLLEKRRQTTDPEEQARLAPFEHRAYAREYVRENPLAAPGMAMFAPAYAVAKKLGLARGRTEPSMDQMFAGIEGVGEGLVEAVKDKWGRK